METSPCEGNNGLLFANFNQDFGCFVCCVSGGRGFRIFNCDPLRERQSRIFSQSPPEAHPDHDFTEVEHVRGGEAVVGSAGPLSSAEATLEAVGNGKARIVKAEMLFRCNYVALVVAASTERGSSDVNRQQEGHKVVIWDDLKQMGVIQLEFNTEVRAVRLRRDRIVVVMKSLIKVYTFTAAPACLHVYDTAPNFKGLSSLSPSSNNSILAFPTSEEPSAPGTGQGSSRKIDKGGGTGSYTGGSVKLIDLAKPDNPSIVIAAHTTSLSCMTLNIQGTRLATASEKGTLIRIFDTLTGNLVNELRRGSQSATIYSINFSPDSSFVVASSSHGTIHVFSTEDSSKNKTSSLVTTATSMMGNLFGSSTGVSSSSSAQASVAPSIGSPNNPGAGTTSDKAEKSVPKFVPKYFTSEWSFSRIEVPGSTRCIVSFASGSSSPASTSAAHPLSPSSSSRKADFSILAVCSDGSYYKFVYDEKKEHFTRDVYQMFVENDSAK